MINTDYKIISEIIIGFFLAIFITRFFYSLYKKKSEIIIAVDNCSECPFKNEWSSLTPTLSQGEGVETKKFNCKLKQIIGVNNLSHSCDSALKLHCPINGKLEITVSKS